MATGNNRDDIEVGIAVVGTAKAVADAGEVEDAVDRVKDSSQQANAQTVADSKEVKDAVDSVTAASKQAKASKIEDLETERKFGDEIRRTAAAAREKSKELRALEVEVAKGRKAARESGGDGLASDQAAVKGIGDLVSKIPGGGKIGGAISGLGGSASAGAGIEAAGAAGPFAALVAMLATTQHLVDKISTLKQMLAEDGVPLGKELAEEFEVDAGIMAPFAATVDFFKEKWEELKDVGSGGTNSAAEAWKQAGSALENLQRLRREIATEKQSFVSDVYAQELAQLREQEATLGRIQQLRSQLGSIAQQSAQADIEIAKQDGGDVALAQAKALNIQIQEALSSLGDDLRMSQAKAETAQREHDKAFSNWTGMSDALTQNLRDDEAKLKRMQENGASAEAIAKIEEKIKSERVELDGLARAVDDSKARLDDAKQAVMDQSSVYAESKNLLIKNAGIELRKLEEAVKDGTSTQAGQELDKIHDVLTAANNETMAAVQTAIGDVQTKNADQRSQTVSAIQSLAPDPQATAAVTGAVADVGKAMTEQSNATILALNKVMLGMTTMTAKIAAQDAKINQLFSRIR